jgi:hypothetical protein
MDLDSARNYLHQHLHPYFDYKKYIEKGELNYERKTRFGGSTFVATVTGDEEVGYVNFFTGIRYNLVELTLKNTYGLREYFEQSSYTLLVNWKNLDRLRAASSIPFRKLSELEAIGDLAIEFMDEKGFDFLNHYKELVNLDRLFNDRSPTLAKWTNHNYYHRFRAMAIAKLRNREDYDTLFEMHREYMVSRGLSGSIVAKFDSTFARLKKLSLN